MMHVFWTTAITSAFHATANPNPSISNPECSNGLSMGACTVQSAHESQSTIRDTVADDELSMMQISFMQNQLHVSQPKLFSVEKTLARTQIPRSSSLPSLPSPMLAGYTSGESVAKITEAVKHGLNVIFWSSMELQANSLVGKLNSKIVGPVHEALVKMKRPDVLHFLSLGGQNVHLTMARTCAGEDSCDGAAYAEAFRAWNKEMKSNISGFPGFAGIDWNIEGHMVPANDTRSISKSAKSAKSAKSSVPLVETVNATRSHSKSVFTLVETVNEEHVNKTKNFFTLTTFEIMRTMSENLVYDFLISLSPPQSFFNCRESGWSMDLKNQALTDPLYNLAGKNGYALLYAKCPECFDLVMVQLYEPFSQAGLELFWGGDAKSFPHTANHSEMKKVIHDNMQCLASGWDVHFDGYWELPLMKVTVPPEKIVLGLASDWADSDSFYKVPFFAGKPSGEAWCDGVLVEGVPGKTPTRGFAYWDMNHEISSASLLSDLSSTMTSCSKVSHTAARSLSYQGFGRVCDFMVWFAGIWIVYRNLR